MKRVLPQGYSRNATDNRKRYCKAKKPKVTTDQQSMNRSTKEEITIRRAIVVEMRAKGVSAAIIAKEFGVNPNTIWKDLKVALKKEAKYALKNSNILRQLELTRLDMALEKIWKKIEAGSFGAVDLLIKMSRRRSAFLGLDADKTIGLTSQPLPWTDEEEPAPWGINIPDRPVDNEINGA